MQILSSERSVNVFGDFIKQSGSQQKLQLKSNVRLNEMFKDLKHLLKNMSRQSENTIINGNDTMFYSTCSYWDPPTIFDFTESERLDKVPLWKFKVRTCVKNEYIIIMTVYLDIYGAICLMGFV